MACTPEQLAAAARYRERNREKVNAERRARYAENPEPQRAASNERMKAKWAAMTPEERLAVGRKRRASEAEQVEQRRVTYERKLRSDVLQGYGGRCACCGTDYDAHLTLDHIDGGGSAERAAGMTNRKLWRRLRAEGFPPGYQVLCWNCNWAKHALGACGCSGAQLREVG